MLFQFAPVIQAGIDSGMYEVVRNTVTKQLLGIARSKATGHFVAQAIGVTTKFAGLTIQPNTSRLRLEIDKNRVA